MTRKIGNEMDASIRVSRRDLAGALRYLHKELKKKNPGEAVLTVEDGALSIRMVNHKVEIPAEGRWNGQAMLDGDLLLRFKDVLPPGEQLEITVKGSELTIGSTRLQCKWQEHVGRSIPLPNNPPLSYLLWIDQEYSDEEIEESGLTYVIENAREEERKLAVRIAKDISGIGGTEKDAEELIKKCFRRKHGP